MKPRVLITGAGAVCGAGRDPHAIFSSLIEGRSAIAPIEGWDTAKWPVRNAAEIRDFNARTLVDDRKLHKLIRRTDMLGIYAGDRAAEAAGYAAHRDSLPDNVPAQPLKVLLSGARGATGHRALELRPFSRRRAVGTRSRGRRRSGPRALPPERGRVRRRLHRRSADLRTWR